LLDSIYQIGAVQEGYDNSLSSLLTRISARHVIGIIFENTASNKIRYQKSELGEFSSPTLHLYRRDFSGRPGLFLTGNISGQDIDKIRKIVSNAKDTNSTEVQKFVRDKILWFPKGKLVTNERLLKSLSENRKNELSQIFYEFQKRGKKIAKDVLKILLEDEPERTLLTIMIQKSSDRRPQYVGQIQEYKEFFKKGVLSKKDEATEKLTCSICNKRELIQTFVEKPLPFYVADKPMFFPDADHKQSRKGFPLCDKCYLETQKGIRFIEEKLNYSIPSVKSNKSEINFWLIPHLNDYELMKEFKNDFGKNKNLYLNSLKDLCSTLRTISKHDHHERAAIESFLRFSALFYMLDSHALVRVINYIQGIYPSQLQKIFEIKNRIDDTYPFQILSKSYGQMTFSVGFPIFVLFYKDTSSQWQSQLISIMEKIFTGQQIPVDEVTQIINVKVRELSLKSLDLKSLSETVNLGLMLLEFLINLNGTVRDDILPENSVPLLREVEDVQKFIDSHTNILSDGTSRAIFATGVCVGILLEIQQQLYNKAAPFWSRLNRLNLDLERLKELFPEVKSKLSMYHEKGYDTIIDYLGVNEISKINWSSTIPEENINFVFTVGLSYGYMLKRGYLKP
jgi:CRISPR-associated Csh1 family protein